VNLRRVVFALVTAVSALVLPPAPAGAAVAGGDVLAYGAPQHGSTARAALNAPIVAVAAATDGSGYYQVASDGGIFTFGGARYHGSLGALRLNQPITGIAPTPTGAGYWLVAADGGVFTFGDAAYLGSTGGSPPRHRVIGLVPTGSGRGYWLVTEGGQVFGFGTARHLGDRSGQTTSPVVGMAPARDSHGYWLATADGNVIAGPAPVASTGSFGFLRIARNGTPVRYNPCAPVRYVVNPAGAPAGAVDEVHEAFRRLGSATGITFSFDGATNEPYSKFGTRKSYQPDRYGDRWAPILVSWAPASIESLLAGGTVGFGGSVSMWSSTTDEAFVTGQVVFDTDLSMLRSGFGAGLTRGNLALHELGHLIGLDHVDDRSQVMYPSVHSASPNGFASGDLTGLRQLGSSSGCLNVVKPPRTLL